MENVAPDSEEILFLAMIRRFEELALEKYRRYVPGLATGEKTALVNRLTRCAPDGGELERSPLFQPMEALLKPAGAEGCEATLIIQGLILENFGFRIYEAIEQSPATRGLTKELSQLGRSTSQTTLSRVPSLVRQELGEKEGLFDKFIENSGEVLGQLDPLWEAAEKIFSEKFQIKFSQVLGRVTADLIKNCVELGINRRDLTLYLTGALMGL